MVGSDSNLRLRPKSDTGTEPATDSVYPSLCGILDWPSIIFLLESMSGILKENEQRKLLKITNNNTD